MVHAGMTRAGIVSVESNNLKVDKWKVKLRNRANTTWEDKLDPVSKRA